MSAATTPADTVPSTFAAHLGALARRQPDAVAVLDRDQPLTAAELHAAVGRLAAGLAQAGVGPGSRVAVWLPNCAEWVVAFLACAHLGALVLAVNTRFRAAEVADILGRGRAQWLVYWPAFKGIDFAAILDDVPDSALHALRGVIALDEAAHSAPVPAQVRGRPVLSWRQLANSHAAVEPSATDDAGVLCFTTSGTTSLPKFVLHDQGTLLRHGHAAAQAYGYDDDARILAAAPFCGAFGFAMLVGALARGVPLVCEPVYDTARTAQAIRRHRITHAFANNEALAQLFQSGQPGDFATLRLCGFASFAPALDNLLELAASHGVPLTGLYGSSELIALVAAQPLDAAQGDVSVRYLAGGLLIYPQARARACDPQSGAVLPHGQSGELQIHTPSLMRGYLDNPQATADALTPDGYFKTGDLGYSVGPRQFVFQARLGDSLRLAGFLVNPAEIEQLVESLPGVRACQVVGATRQGKTVPYAFVLLHPGAQADPHAWHAACRRALAGFKVPAGFHVLQSFPSVESANSVKIQKHKLRDMAIALLAAAPAGTRP
ncbi:AMP-binding protein [Bordetella sp. BOR01]|uniref:AMP-binding protein n=1 Tax=Bordetella sp. BOR01 TaxID=2854779 RepID=UPI001C43E92D|nr:AMP-binding protein [Bordetella sp. BOR01]MBV7481598.1 AMP-binding protein [Bordetella sp. BOR01]